MQTYESQSKKTAAGLPKESSGTVGFAALILQLNFYHIFCTAVPAGKVVPIRLLLLELEWVKVARPDF